MNLKVVFIGNSIVAGYPWNKGKSFVSVLRKFWKDDNVGIEIINKGVNGDTTAGIKARFKNDVLNHDPDIVFYMTGTNDFIYRDASPDEAFVNLEEMAAAADKLNAVSVFITPLPVDAGKAECMWMAGCGISYDAVNRDLDLFSELIRSSGRPYVDMNSLYPVFVEQTGDVDLAYLDGLHPMPAGHEFIAEQVLRFIRSDEDIAALLRSKK